MKSLEKDKIKILLNIMGSNPSQHIAHFTQGGKTFTEALFHYCEKYEYLYQINCTDDNSFKEISSRYIGSPIVNVRKLPLEIKSYMMQAKQYDFVFVTSVINKTLRDDFLKKIHKIILNAGNLIIFVAKDDRKEKYNWIELLEKNYYVATSSIDDLFENYDVIISKKMHGWGNK